MRPEGGGAGAAMAKMESHELATKILREESAPILEALMRTMADPTAKAREKLKAVREFKQCLHSLKRVVEARQTAPALRRDLIEVLRISQWYRFGILQPVEPGPSNARKDA